LISTKIQNKKKNLPKTINVKNETEAEQTVKNLRKEGNNPRAILKIKIMINGKKYPLNIKGIKDICEGTEQKTEETAKCNEAEYFKLFKKSYTPNDVVDERGCPYDPVDEAFNKFQKYSGKILVSSREYETLLSLVRKVNPNVRTFEDANLAIETGVDDHLMLQKYKYHCPGCGEEKVIGEDEMPSLLQYLKDQGYAHVDCSNKPKPEPPLKINLLDTLVDRF